MGTYTQMLEAFEVGKKLFASYAGLARASKVSEANISRWRRLKQTPSLVEFAPILDSVGAQILYPGQSIRDFVRIFQIKNDMAKAIQELRTDSRQDLSESVHERHDLSESAHQPHDFSENFQPNKDFSSIFQRTSDISFKPYILDTLSPDHSKLALYIVTNDETMSPILRKGDQAIVNLAKTKIEDGELYLIEKDNGLWIRRIFRDYDKIKLFTESKYLPPTIITPDEFTIIGKVVWIGHFC